MKTLFILNGPSDNRGCEAIMLSTYDLVRTAFPDATFINATQKGQRDSSVDYLKLENLVHRPHPGKGLTTDFLGWQFAKRFRGCAWSFERFLPQSDVVMSLGGDNYSMDYDAIEKHLGSNDRVVRAGKKLVIWGASIGPFETGSKIEDWSRRSLSECHAVVIREHLTQDYLASIGVTENVHVMPDPAFSLTPDPIALDADVEGMLADGAIGLNLSPLLARYRKDPAAWPETAADWLISISEASNAPILLIPHVMYPGNDDYAFLEEVMQIAMQKKLEQRIRLVDARSWSSRHLKFLISRLRAFIGARTHATIAGMSRSVPTISIGYSVKARGINLDVFGTDKWVIDHKTLTGDKLAALLQEMLTKEDAVRAQLQEKNKTYRMDPAVIRQLVTTGRVA